MSIGGLGKVLPVHVGDVEVVLYIPQFCSNASKRLERLFDDIEHQDWEPCGECVSIYHE